MNSEHEHELISRLVLTGHLNVPERRQLSPPITGSQFRRVIVDALTSGAWFRGWWFPDDSMFGCVIEFRGLGGGQLERRYTGIESGWAEAITEFSHPSAEAAASTIVAQAQSLIRDHIDGIPIDWER